MTVAIAICTYNGEKYLATQLDSILQQTQMPDEIVVCDDGSNDATIKILENYKTRYPNVFKIHCNDTNLGYFKNFEKAINLCSSDIIITSDQDDIWKPNKIEVTKRYFKENPHHDGVFNDLEIIGENGQIIEPSYLNWKNISYDFIQKHIVDNTLLVQQQGLGSFILGCALAIRKSAIEKYDLKNFTLAHDLYISQKLSAKNKLGFIPQALSQYRQHDNQVCGLRAASKQTHTATTTVAEASNLFHTMVGGYLLAVRQYSTLYPDENVKTAVIYHTFIKQRNAYLKKLPLFTRKKYILQCIRHSYLDLQPADFFKF